MRRIALALTLALLLPLAACGGNGHDDDFCFGSLTVCNDPFSDFVIIDVEVEDESGTVIYENVDIVPDECLFIDEFFPDDYFVRLVWSDGFVDEIDVFIDECEDQFVTGLNEV